MPIEKNIIKSETNVLLCSKSFPSYASGAFDSCCVYLGREISYMKRICITKGIKNAEAKIYYFGEYFGDYHIDCSFFDSVFLHITVF